MKFIMNDIRPWEWNPLWVLMEIYEGLFLISEMQEISMGDRVKAVEGRMKLIPKVLDNSREMMILYSSQHLSYGNLVIDNIINIIDDIPLKLNSDNLTLDEIDISINKSKKSLLDYRKWLNQKYARMTPIQFPVDLKFIDNAFSHFVGKKYISKNVYRLAEKKHIPIQDQLFELSLPIYLNENDEPVWLDRDDTLEVIHWTIDYIRNKPENQVPMSGILSHFYESISNIEKFIFSKGVIPKNIQKRIKLLLSSEYVFSSDFVSLFGQYPNKFNSEIIYYVKNDENIGDLFPLISQEIDIVNAQNINPGKMIQLAYAQKNYSPIRYMFTDPINDAGWKNYAVNLLLDEGYGKFDQSYRILLLKEELMIICRGIVEGEYYSGTMSRKDAISYLRKEGFVNNSEAENLMIKSELNYFSGTQAFIGMMEMASLKKEYEINAGDNFNLFNFHQEILRHGVIPFYQLKKEVLAL